MRRLRTKNAASARLRTRTSVTTTPITAGLAPLWAPLTGAALAEGVALLWAFDLVAGEAELAIGVDVVAVGVVATTGFGGGVTMGVAVGSTTEGAGGALATTGGRALPGGVAVAAAAADAAARRDESDAFADERNASSADCAGLSAPGGRTGNRL